jgi:lincosamide nucleotidyltransferase A/C/D/E
MVMRAASVLAVLAELESAGLRAWVAGGWGVDAVVGRETREHGDLDLAVDTAQLADTIALLESMGYTIETDWRPARLSMATAAGDHVDLHPVRFAADGSAVQSSTDDATFFYRANGFIRGEIGGVAVPCLSVEQQLAFRTGYPPRDVDRHDVALLEALRPESA